MAGFSKLLMVLGILLLSGVTNLHADGKSGLGVILPLTGPLAEYGSALRNGITLALGKNPLTVSYEDSAGDPSKAVTAFNKLVADAGGPAIMYIWGSAESAAVAPVAERAGIPTFFSTSDPDGTKSAPTFGVRFFNEGHRYSTLLAKYLKDSEFKSVGILKVEIAYFNALESSLRAAVGSDVEISVPFTFSPSDADFGTVIAKMRTKKFDVLGVFLLPAQVSQFYLTARNQKFTFASFGTDVFESSKVLSDAKGALSGAVVATDQVKAPFVEIYEKKFGNRTHLPHAANGYEFLHLAAPLLNGRHTGPQIMTAISGITTVTGEAIDYERSSTTASGISFEFPVTIERIP